MRPFFFLLAQAHAPAAQPPAAAAGQGAFNAGDVILTHVANTPIDHPLIHIPLIFGIDMSVTKHVFMLWAVALLMFVVVTTLVRAYLRQSKLVPAGAMRALEVGVEFVQDTIVQPNVGKKWAPTWTPLILTLFLFILFSN